MDSENAHPSSSITLWASPVKHWEARKSQQSSCYCVCSKCILSKLMVLYLPAWRFGLNNFHKLADCAESGRQRGWLQVPAICRWQWLHHGPLPLSGHLSCLLVRSLWPSVCLQHSSHLSRSCASQPLCRISEWTGSMPKQDLRTACSRFINKISVQGESKEIVPLIHN